MAFAVMSYKQITSLTLLEKHLEVHSWFCNYSESSDDNIMNWLLVCNMPRKK